MLNVVIITPGFAVDENDLVCVPFLQLYIQALLTEEVKLHIITTQYPAKKNYMWHGIDIITITKKEPKLISKIAFKYRLNNALEAIHAIQQIDVIHDIWFNDSTLLSDRFAVKHHIKHITTFAGRDVLADNKALKNLGRYKGILACVSTFQQLKFNENHNAITELVPWGIENMSFQNAIKPIDLIFCGSINTIKNHSKFIDIVYKLSKTLPDLKVVICGSGEEFDLMYQKIKSLKIEKNVILKGSIPRPEVIELMKQSKILVHTSTFEGFGMVLAEGLACCCKVISTPVGIAYHSNVITNCNTTAEFVIEISKQLLSAKTVVPVNNYSINETVKRYLMIYKNI